MFIKSVEKEKETFKRLEGHHHQHHRQRHLRCRGIYLKQLCVGALV